MSNNKFKVVGFAWYAKENWDKLKSIFEDADKLHSTYPEWLSAAEHGVKQMEARGVSVVKVEIRPEEFLSWCQSRGMNVNAAARSQFANEGAFSIYRHKG